MRKRFLIPRFWWGTQLGDGLHGDSFFEGRGLIIAWLGLHVELIFAIETAWPEVEARDDR